MTYVESAYALPEKNQKYQVVVRIADKEIKINPEEDKENDKEVNKGYFNRYRKQIKVDEALFIAPY